jgi:hypothetical protein
MNYNNEPFPVDPKVVFERAFDMATIALVHLNQKDCPRLEELFFEMHKTCGAQPEFSIWRNKKAFEDLGYVPNIKSGKSKSLNEFKGLYFFGEKKNDRIFPIYVGVSRTVYRRLRQHAFGKRHNECSLAYLMTGHDNKEINRANVHNNFNDDLSAKKEVVRNLHVALIPVQEDYDLYFLEVALAGILKTKWNSFRTH